MRQKGESVLTLSPFVFMDFPPYPSLGIAPILIQAPDFFFEPFGFFFVARLQGFKAFGFGDMKEFLEVSFFRF